MKRDKHHHSLDFQGCLCVACTQGRANLGAPCTSAAIIIILKMPGWCPALPGGTFERGRCPYFNLDMRAGCPRSQAGRLNAGVTRILTGYADRMPALPGRSFERGHCPHFNFDMRARTPALPGGRDNTATIRANGAELRCPILRTPHYSRSGRGY